jgi:predicted lipoprotein with Yx(FWY)xxD motif
MGKTPLTLGNSPLLMGSTCNDGQHFIDDGQHLQRWAALATMGKTRNGDCLCNWPAFVAGHNDHALDDFSIITHEDDTRQWTHRNLPVHFFHKDVMPM